jgi:hypothetical protein
MWHRDGGQGDLPAAWIRATDGVVRFNFGRFQRPNLGGHTNEPLGPIRTPPGRAPQAPPPAGGGGSIIREFARLPEHAGRPPLFGPDSKVSHVVTDQQEAQQYWNRLVAERQVNILEHDADFAQVHWSDDGGKGPPPIAWVRASDGVIRFNLALFQRPPPIGGPGNGG